MPSENASCSVFFDETHIVVASYKGSLLGWMSVLVRPVDDAILGSRVIDGWSLRERGDPNAAVPAEVDESERPICELFGADAARFVKLVAANRVRGRILAVSSELKGDDNRYMSERVEVPIDADAATIGAAVREAMGLTLS